MKTLSSVSSRNKLLTDSFAEGTLIAAIKAFSSLAKKL